LDLPQAKIEHIIDLALTEDISHGDITTSLLVPPGLQGQAKLLVKAEGVLAGIGIARQVFLKVDPSLRFEITAKDGEQVKAGDIIATISGSVASILQAERVALNFLQRLSGIAAQTAQHVAKTQGLAVKITDTRKTTPGLRALEKYAVLMGGGHNHRLNLGDGILIKDNHLAALRALGMGIKEIVAKAKEEAPPGSKVEIEVTNEREALDAAQAGADIIMLDNMSQEDMRHVVSLLPGHIIIEASGGITLDNVQTTAMTGVDTISIGALTHSPQALDISLELEPQTLKLL